MQIQRFIIAFVFEKQVLSIGQVTTVTHKRVTYKCGGQVLNPDD